MSDCQECEGEIQSLLDLMKMTEVDVSGCHNCKSCGASIRDAVLARRDPPSEAQKAYESRNPERGAGGEG